MVKSAELTKSERLMDFETVAFVPVTVRVKFPGTDVGLAVSVRVDAPGGMTGLGDRFTATPGAVVVAPKKTGELSPFTERTVIVMLVAEPLRSFG